MFSHYLFRWSSYYKMPDPDRRLIAYSWCDLYRFGLSFIRSALLKGFLSLAALASLANNSEATIKEKRFRLLHILAARCYNQSKYRESSKETHHRIDPNSNKTRLFTYFSYADSNKTNMCSLRNRIRIAGLF